MQTRMLDGNTQAEIDNDTQTSAQEYAEYERREALYVHVLNSLLSGKTVDVNGFSVNLAERMADQYEEFSALVDLDHDYMAEFIAGTIDPAKAELIRAEAMALASKVVG